MTTVIGFLTYENFLAEMQAAGIKTVRLQDYYRRRDAGNGLPWTDFYVELAAAQGQGNEVYACRFHIGGGLNTEMDQPCRQRDQANSEWVMGFLRQDLEGKGFQVRPGIITAAKEAEIITEGPWRYERDEQGLPMFIRCQ